MTFPTDAAIITRRKSLGISIAMCGSCYFKALPRIFQRFIFLAEQGSCATFTGANCACVRNAWPQGNFEPPEELQRPSAPRATAPSFPSGRERKRAKQCNPQQDRRLIRLLAQSN